MITILANPVKAPHFRGVFFRLRVLWTIGFSVLAGLFTACEPQHYTLAGGNLLRIRKPTDFYPKAGCAMGYYSDSLLDREHFYFLDRTSNALLHAEMRAASQPTEPLEFQKFSLQHLFHHTAYPIEALGVFSPDSLLFVDGEAHNLCLTDAHGAIRQQWQPRSPIYGRTPYYIDTGLQPIYTHGSLAYLHCGPDDGGSMLADTNVFRRIFAYNSGLVLNVRDSLFASNTTGRFPSFLSAKNNFNIIVPQTCVAPNGDFLFAYGPFSEIYRYSLNGKKQVVNAPSRHHRPARGLPFAALQDHQALINYKLTEPEYGPIISDPFRRRYLRVYRHGMPTALSEPMRPSYADMPWSLLILNEDLQVVGEVELGANYDPRLILATRRGVLIGNQRPESTGYDPQQLSFQLFTYQTATKPSS